jgi:hypothetical protein
MLIAASDGSKSFGGVYINNPGLSSVGKQFPSDPVFLLT